jgi:molybdate transport system ATP-binding protein
MSRLAFDCRHRHGSGFELEARFDSGDGVTALFGPSGSGKTTILGLIAGLLQPQSGTIRLGEGTLVDVAAGMFVPPEQRHIGFVFQDHLLFPHLTVGQNLRFGQRRRPARAIDFARVVHILEIGGLLDRNPHTLSGGQRQRVALGRALLRGPDLLLMDEPLTALDEGLKDRVLTYLERAVAEWRIPTMFVSHDQTDVRRLADSVVVLEAGRVIDAGPTAATLDRAALTRLKRPISPVNLLRVSGLRQVGEHWEGTVGDQRLYLPPSPAYCAGASVSVQFLPQDVILSRVPEAGVSARNQLQGTVRELVALPGRTFVAVDVGQFLWVEVMPETVREFDIRPGVLLTCMIKVSALDLLE